MTTSTLLTSLLQYKAWANAELGQTLSSVDAAQFGKDLHTCIRLWNHTHVVDKIFSAHLQGIAHGYSNTNTPETPPLAQLIADIAAQDQWLIGFAQNADEASLETALHFTFTDGKAARMSRQEMLMHLVTHGGYHRGAIGRILSQIGVAAPRDVFTGFLHTSEPERRLA